jgi:hypothetical protein
MGRFCSGFLSRWERVGVRVLGCVHLTGSPGPHLVGLAPDISSPKGRGGGERRRGERDARWCLPHTRSGRSIFVPHSGQHAGSRTPARGAAGSLCSLSPWERVGVRVLGCVHLTGSPGPHLVGLAPDISSPKGRGGGERRRGEEAGRVGRSLVSTAHSVRAGG